MKTEKTSLSSRKMAFCILLFVCSAFTSNAMAISEGDQIPSFNLPGNTSKTVSLADYSGKLVLLDFWASWCAPCKKSFPALNQLHKKMASRGLEIIAINLDQDRSDADKFLAELNPSFTIAFDSLGEVPEKFGVKTMPTSMLIGRDGKIIKIFAGFRESSANELEDIIEHSLK